MFEISSQDSDPYTIHELRFSIWYEIHIHIRLYIESKESFHALTLKIGALIFGSSFLRVGTKRSFFSIMSKRL